MRKTNEELRKMEEEKLSSIAKTDKMVSKELLKMGFSYNQMGTHYLHESIVIAASLKLENFSSVDELCLAIGKKICRKYGIRNDHYSSSVSHSIEKAFEVGNIDYLLDTFKSSYDRDKMKVVKNTFIMTVRKKIMEEMEEEQEYSANQLRVIIQGTVEKIRDISVLEGLCKIVLFMENGITV